ncbi:alkaline phosphatase D family protein [Hyphobacterium sp.]|uniref:alkaline phosphatase D family protein n=1 Tax=Hyphobacterium sp. TaxID=2004662 RepID=UPI003BA8DABA
MRVALVLALAVSACAAAQPTDPEEAPADWAPATVFEALRPFYAHLDYEPPHAGEVLTLDPRQPLTRIAFGSCHDPEHEGMEILSRVAGDRPDVFIYTGDNVYGDTWTWDATLPELREAYAMLAATDHFQTLRSTTPLLATWDDHDYGMNDFGGGFPYKEFAETLFLDFWDIPENDARRTRPGIYASDVYGPEGQRTQIILLDTRYFRTDLARSPQRGEPGMERYVPTDDPDQNMLGDAQWAWLADQLQVPADLRLVVTSIQLHADGHGWEAWRTMPAERQRFYDLIGESGAEGVIIVSGDRHSSGLYVREDVIGYPLYEITSSSLNRSFHDENNEPGPHRIGEMYAPVNYGVIDVNWGERFVSLQIRDAEGAVVRHVEVALDSLRHR